MIYEMTNAIETIENWNSWLKRSMRVQVSLERLMHVLA